MNDSNELGRIRVVDLFCGIGGLSHGFVKEGFHVVAGIDIDESCQYAYEKNNGARFICKDIADVTPAYINRLLGGKKRIRILAGCAPCQPFSTLNLDRQTGKRINYRPWAPLRRFIHYIEEIRPEIISMENVRELGDEAKYPIFRKFIETLEKNNYEFWYSVVNTARYGVPQRRHRLVLLASQLGKISMIPETHSEERPKTVRDAISHLPSLMAGGKNPNDPIHCSSRLSKNNLLRIKATRRNGGNMSSWPKELKLKCHLKKSGKSYASTVYARMRWNDVSPTITTECNNLGSGRFGHPVQNRAISLREAALLQSFPRAYKFVESDEFSTQVLARHIGNAIPVGLARAIAKSIKIHIKQYS